jgi:hypothetical protein
MRKGFLIGLMIALMLAIMPVAAQDEESVAACTPEELAITGEALSTLGAGFQEITASLGDGTDTTALTTGVVALEILSEGFWNEIYPEMPGCPESVSLSYNFGLAIDASIINIGLARLALYEAEFGDAAIAQSYAEYAAARAEWYATIVQSTFGQIAEDGTLPEAAEAAELPACTEDDKNSEASTALVQSISAYQELGGAMADATPEEQTALVGGYAGLSAVYWVEIYPALPACAELSTFSYNLGLVYDETLITALLSRLALYEAENGDADLATALSEGAVNRLAMLQSFYASAFPQAQPTEEAE